MDAETLNADPHDANNEPTTPPAFPRNHQAGGPARKPLVSHCGFVKSSLARAKLNGGGLSHG